MAEHYTDEDVQAAVRVLQQPRMHTNMSGDKHRADMRAVLDAVAPAIAARALREAAEAMANGGAPKEVTLCHHDVNHGEPIDWLMARADEIEGR